MFSRANALVKTLQEPWGRQPVRHRVEGYAGQGGAGVDKGCWGQFGLSGSGRPPT